MLRKIFFAVAVAGLIVVGVAALIALPWPAIAALVLVLALGLALTRAGRRVGALTAAAVVTLPQRLGGASVVVVGIAGVVGVLVSLLAMGKGYESTLGATGSRTTAIVLRSGALSESTSNLGPQSVLLIGQEPQVARNAHGQPLASPEVVTAVSLPKRAGHQDASVTLRGVGPQVWAVSRHVRIVAGRRFGTGLRQLIVGRSAAREFAHTAIGDTLELNGVPWKIVGEFAGGEAHDSELWGDVHVVGAAFHRGSSVQSVTVRLIRPSAFAAFKAALASDPRLKVQAHTTRQYYAEQSKGTAHFIRILGLVVAGIMAVGAVAGALNSMYAAVAARTREIATLRAIGFRGATVVASVLIETMLLALGGGIAGALIAWLLFHDFTAATMGANFGAVVFNFRVTPQLMGTGLKWALAIGFFGGLLPALRAARVPVTDGLREL